MFLILCFIAIAILALSLLKGRIVEQETDRFLAKVFDEVHEQHEAQRGKTLRDISEHLK